MKWIKWVKNAVSLLLVVLIPAACGGGTQTLSTDSVQKASASGIGQYLTITDFEPDTVDPQRTSGHYLIALNVFDRLVEVEVNDDGSMEIRPSLADSWEISDDGCTYTFHLRENVKFSSGARLTASDVLYTFTRLLTLPDAANADIVADIVGAAALSGGEADTLEGFLIIDEYTFAITPNYSRG